MLDLAQRPQPAQAFLNLLFRALALDGVAYRAHQQVAVHFSFDEIVLGALAQRAGRQLFVLKPREDHDRQMRDLPVRPHHGVEPLRIGQREIEQDDLEAPFVEAEERFSEPIDVRQVELAASRLCQGLAQQTRISRIIFDQKNFNGQNAHVISATGSFTIVSQNSSIDLTTSMNCPRSTGLLM